MNCSTTVTNHGAYELSEIVEDGVSREILVNNDSIMMTRSRFKESAIGTIQTHKHSQLVYVEKGVFEFCIDNKLQRLVSGDFVFVPKSKIRGAVCLEEGVLLDVFTPADQSVLT